MEPVHGISLLDLAYKHAIDVWLVFREIPSSHRTHWMWRFIKPGFRHVEVWKNTRGIWIRIDAAMEYADVEAYELSPFVLTHESLTPTFLRVQRAAPHGRLREPFHIGPLTCVELVKSYLGLRRFWIRTPFQLYKYLRKNHGT